MTYVTAVVTCASQAPIFWLVCGTRSQGVLFSISVAWFIRYNRDVKCSTLHWSASRATLWVNLRVQWLEKMTIVKEQTVTPAVTFFADNKKYHDEQATWRGFCHHGTNFLIRSERQVCIYSVFHYRKENICHLTAGTYTGQDIKVYFEKSEHSMHSTNDLDLRQC